MAQRITAPRGTQDILPEESYRWHYVEKMLMEVMENFGFKEIRLPTFEHTELFLRGVGDTTDIVNKEMYTFSDKAGRSITLRPEGTSNTVRATLEHGLLGGALPLKAYYLQSNFRYEKPQKGRLREFHQIGIEVFGAPGAAADVEVIATGAEILRRAGLKEVKLEINSLGCPACRPAYHEALKGYFRSHEEKLCGTCRERLDKNPLRILDCKSPECQAVASGAPVMREFLCDECKDHFAAVQKGLDNLGIAYEVNPTIVRGLDYYTKTVFEFIHTGAGSQGTVCGGGRYDGLFEELGGPATPGVGFGLGIERLLMVMEAEGAPIPEDRKPDLYLASIGEKGALAAAKLALALRRQGKYVMYDLMDRSLKAQMKFADKTGAAYVLVLGDDEVASRSGKLKQMQTGKETEISFGDLEQFSF